MSNLCVTDISCMWNCFVTFAFMLYWVGYTHSINNSCFVLISLCTDMWKYIDRYFYLLLKDFSSLIQAIISLHNLSNVAAKGLGVVLVSTVIQLFKTKKRAVGRSKQDTSTKESTGLTTVTLRQPCITRLHCCTVSLFSLQTVKLKETPPLSLCCVWTAAALQLQARSVKQMAAIRKKPK